MATDWNDILSGWVKPASDAEEERRDRTENEIRTALADYTPLPNTSLRIFAQGSYKNNTNVRLKSDVDIAVEYQEGEAEPTATPSIATTDKIGSAKELTKAELGLVDHGTYDPTGFKDHVEAAMRKAFGHGDVKRGEKAIRIRGDVTTLPADVVPCFPHRRYESRTVVHRGVRLFPDSGGPIENYPQQHYENGVDKNDRTGRRFKRMVRAFKRMNHYLQEQKGKALIPSFTIESMVYNVPDGFFATGSYLDDFVKIAEHMWYQTYKAERCEDWAEVNDLKYLFRGTGRDQRKPASDFAWDAWKEVTDD